MKPVFRTICGQKLNFNKVQTKKTKPFSVVPINKELLTGTVLVNNSVLTKNVHKFLLWEGGPGPTPPLH